MHPSYQSAYEPELNMNTQNSVMVSWAVCLSIWVRTQRGVVDFDIAGNY